MDVVSRRLELLKLEGLGVNRVEIVKQLSQKYRCSKRSIYNDFETRATWQPSLLGAARTGDISLKVFNRLEQMYAQASRLSVSSPNLFVQIAALNQMFKVNSKMAEFAALPDIEHRLRVLEEKVEQKNEATESVVETKKKSSRKIE